MSEPFAILRINASDLNDARLEPRYRPGLLNHGQQWQHCLVWQRHTAEQRWAIEREKQRGENARWHAILAERQGAYEKAEAARKAKLAENAPIREAARKKYAARDWHSILPAKWAEEQIGWDMRATALRMRECGLTQKAIGEKFGLSGTRVAQMIRVAERVRGKPTPCERHFAETRDLKAMQDFQPPKPTKAQRFVSAWETYAYAA